MHVRESDLPGIGKKFEINTRGGDKLVVIIHDDGRREMYHFEYDDPDQTISTITLDDDEARQIAAIVGGMTYTPKALETVEMAFDELIIEWYKIDSHYKSIGKTIGGLDLRQKSGAMVIAVIEKNHTKHVSPGPELVITNEATLVVVGERQQQKLIKQILLNGSG
ncbi:cation:proton antiporter regulatory subunit [Paenibacillus agricola]|uniref:Cation:proton antiporter regulatory subunit n=1 Tax=Paenibacillus agricola TaxID=2716264 RepID=A0ABX0J7Q4_9BACL|nr:cation:proton antiporter regulatory subunit [Paenibacillus agricola]NHN32405.1 cation:proton antiporter regulatory subunit [Paenibacillus agricola]